VPGARERPGESRARPAGPDDADPQPRRMLACSSLHRYRTAPFAGESRC
jgi:hypothetical protein